MASEPILSSTALHYLLKEERGWFFTLNLLKWDTGITGSTNKLPVRGRTLAQPHRCDAVLPTYKPSWANSLSSSFSSTLLWPEKWKSRLIGLENEMASNWLVHFKSWFASKVRVCSLLLEWQNLAWRVQVFLQAASVFWCNPISTSFGKEGKGEAELKTK